MRPKHSRVTRTKKVMSREQLEALHTKQLIARQRYFYRFWDEEGNFNVNRSKRGWDQYVLYEGTAGDAEKERAWIKEILANREHIPNKKECKEKRKDGQKAAKHGGARHR